MAHFLKPGPDISINDIVRRATEILLAGGAIAYPTETFYGLGVNAEDETAVCKIFEIKGRDFNNPVSVIIGHAFQLSSLVRGVSPAATKLIDAFWPGPLTIVFEASPNVSPRLTSQTGKIGVRLASSDFARRLALNAGVPITATSANLSGGPICSTAQAVLDQIGLRIDAVIELSEKGSTIGSTILDASGETTTILRLGLITPEDIKRKTGLDVRTVTVHETP